jgi:DNA modification methylase
MRFVAEAKINASVWARANLLEVRTLFSEYLKDLRSERFARRARGVSLASYERAFPQRDFFKEAHLRELLAARDLANEIAVGVRQVQHLLLLAVAANTVLSSHMTRRADLRRRRADEYKQRVVDVRRFVSDKLADMMADLELPNGPTAPMRHVSDDARSAGQVSHDQFDLAITSPPYLNGTNYFRNTKLELWLLGFLDTESDLRLFTSSAVAAGINNVSRERVRSNRFDSVEEVVSRLEKVGGDKRIPLLVRYYFSDMYDVAKSIHAVLRPGGRFLIDIGDSKFYGIHVPTDKLLASVAEDAGFTVEESRYLAARKSYDKSALHQVELVLRKSEKGELSLSRPSPAGTLPLAISSGLPQTKATSTAGLKSSISDFGRQLPYKAVPYCQRNWGHALHSLCSYQGKLKPSIAHWLIRMFSTPGMSILDPLGGVGTIAFEACSQGRYGITNDLSPLAFSVASGKVAVPNPIQVEAAVERLANALKTTTPAESDRVSAQFGLNGRVCDYYHSATLEEILLARRYFLQTPSLTDADLFLKACLLHVLHGNRPYALSRTSHPITPFHPSGPTKYKPLIAHIRRRADAMLAAGLPPAFTRGLPLFGDFRQLPSRVTRVDRIITSPPFWGMRFDRPNWLRMWFCGWDEQDFHELSRSFLERQQKESLDVYREFYKVCREMLRPGGLMILHLGGSDKHAMLETLLKMARETFEVRSVVTEDVSKVETHGIKDRGLTKTHNFIFLQ